ncbi:MAG: hypothetical protein QNJ57_13145 [Flavobacteriaceae bacterium]|nr:hypothetical protein [Flavobacteriaceae bacterium]
MAKREKKAEKPSKDARKKPETQVRPKCDCETAPPALYVLTGAPPPSRRNRFRFVITLKSSSVCDPGTPGQCEYNYEANIRMEKQPLRGRNRPWTPYNKRAGFLQSFTIHDDVNQTIKPDRVDKKRLSIGFFKPNAPLKEKADVTIIYVLSNRGGMPITLKEKVELCLPKGGTPLCPAP